jgi:hypothetical protein
MLAALAGTASANLVFGPPVGRPIITPCHSCAPETPSEYFATADIGGFIAPLPGIDVALELEELDVACGGGNTLLGCGSETFSIDTPLSAPFDPLGPLATGNYIVFLDGALMAPVGTQGTLYACVFEVALSSFPDCLSMAPGQGQISDAINFTGAGSTPSGGTTRFDVNGPIYGFGFELVLPDGLAYGDSITNDDVSPYAIIGPSGVPEPSSLLSSLFLMAFLLVPVAIRRLAGKR